MRRTRSREVALAFPVSVPWMAQCAQGIAEYARQQGHWKLTTSPPALVGADELALTPATLCDWNGDGVIAVVTNASEARAAGRLSVPVVNLASVLRRCRLPRVMVDQAAIGQLAAAHLLDCRLRRLAYCGLQGPWYSQQRQQAFVEGATQAGVSCNVFEMPRRMRRTSWRQQTDLLMSWLRGLSTPVGILAVHDYRARVLLDACRRLELNVPNDVAVLGVDNDLTICEACDPTLSSVSRNSWEVGYRAAELLDRLMAGRSSACSEILIPPDGVVVRRSTDTIGVEDPHVREAIQFMQDHLAETFGIVEVLDHVAVSRRLLEKRFRRCLDCSPYEFLRRLRVRRASQLLALPHKQKLYHIAAACGFSDSKQLRIAFQETVNMTPSEYRHWLHTKGERHEQGENGGRHHK